MLIGRRDRKPRINHFFRIYTILELYQSVHLTLRMLPLVHIPMTLTRTSHLRMLTKKCKNKIIYAPPSVIIQEIMKVGKVFEIYSSERSHFY